jgi:death on curing protein
MPVEQFLSLDQVISIHNELIDTFGGSYGIRDIGLLDSAIHQPLTSFGGEMLHPDLASKAAAYLFHIIKNHPFIDGNKRTASIAATVFLHLNGYSIKLSNAQFFDLALGIATSKIRKEKATEIIRHSMRKI